MPLKFMDGATLRTITRLKLRDGGVTRDIRTLKFMDGGTLRTIATFVTPVTLSVSPTSNTARDLDGDGTATSTSFTATPSGGWSPFTYAWTRLTGTTGAANSPTSAVSTFSATVPADTSTTSTFRCTVTDSLGQTATADISILFVGYFEGIGGG